MLGWVRRRRQLWKKGRSAQPAGSLATVGASSLGYWRGGWLGPSSLHALSLLSGQLRLRLEGDTPDVRLQWALPPPTTGLHLAGHCCLAVGAWTWSLTPRGRDLCTNFPVPSPIRNEQHSWR